MKNILKTFGLHLGVFSVLALTFGIAYAAWDSTVNTGDQLTASSWNELVGKVKNMDSSLSFNGGKVGVGTTSPTVKLEVIGEIKSRNTGAGIISNTTTAVDGYNAYILENDTHQWNIALQGSRLDNFEIQNTTATMIPFAINQVGNVGIGTTSPLDKLQVGNGSSWVSIGINKSPTSYGDFMIRSNGVLRWRIGATDGESGGNTGSDFYIARNSDDGTDLFSGLVINRSTGNLGIGTSSPSQKLEVNGTALATAWNTTSDKRLKTHIVELESPLEKLESIRGVSFDWKEDEKHDIGVIAQEVEAVLPEIVTTDNEGMKSVDYSKLTPLLIEAVKELKNKNTLLEERITRLEK